MATNSRSEPKRAARFTFLLPAGLQPSTESKNLEDYSSILYSLHTSSKAALRVLAPAQAAGLQGGSGLCSASSRTLRAVSPPRTRAGTGGSVANRVVDAAGVRNL